MAAVTVPPIRKLLVGQVRLGDIGEARSWRARLAAPLRGRPAAHAGIEIAWIRSGEAEYRLEGGAPFSVRAGQIVVVPSCMDHTTSFHGDFEAGALELTGETARAIADAVTRPCALRAGIVGEAGDVRELLGALDEELHTDSPGRPLAVQALAEALLVRVLRGAESRDAVGGARLRPRDPRIRRALEYLEANAAEAIGVEELAAAAGMSRFHFSRVFRDEVGASPYAYLLGTRLDRAAARLRSGGCSVTTAAFDAGFHDLGRFAKAFRMRFGAAPSELISSTRRSSHRTRASS